VTVTDVSTMDDPCKVEPIPVADNTRNPGLPYESTTLQFSFINNQMNYIEHGVPLDTTVAKLKQRIEERIGYPPTYLLKCGVKMEARKSLKEHEFIDGDWKTLHVSTLMGRPCSHCNQQNTFEHACIH